MTTNELLARGIGHNCLSDAYEMGKTDAIEACVQILFEAIAKEGKTKCHNYMVALEKMKKLKEQKDG